MRSGIWGTVAAALLGLTGCDGEWGPGDRFQEDFHKTFEVKPGASLSVENSNGSIEVIGTDTSTVDVSGTKYASTKELLSELKVDMTGSSDSVRIRTDRPDFWHGNGGVRYTIKVPRKMVLDRVQSSNGALRIEGVEGPERLKTSNGSIRVSGTKGNLQADTSNGRVDVRDHKGDADVHTSNGSIDAEVSGGRFQAHTSNGKINARLTDPPSDGSVRCETSNGHVEVRVEAKDVPDMHLRSSNSSIVVFLPATANARVRAHSRNGSIRSEFSGLVDEDSRRKRDASGTIGSGGHVIDIETSGSVEILKR